MWLGFLTQELSNTTHRISHNVRAKYAPVRVAQRKVLRRDACTSDMKAFGAKDKLR